MTNTHQIKTIDDVMKTFDEKFYSKDSTTCTWHRNADLKRFLFEAMLTAVDQCTPEEYNHAVGENAENPNHEKDELWCCIDCARDAEKNSVLSDMDSLKSSFFGEK